MNWDVELESAQKGLVIFVFLCVQIAKYVGMPLLIGAGIFLVVGVPIGIISFIPCYFLRHVVSPVFRLINKITFLGRIVTSLLSIVVSITIAVAIFCFLVLPLFFGLVSSLDYDTSIHGSLMANLNVPFWRWFDWAFRWLDMGHVWPGGDEMVILGMLKCLLLAPFLTITNGMPLLGALATLGWGLQMVIKPDK